MLRSPFVILEGPDGSGKTTLAEAFVKQGFSYAHCGPPERNAFEHWYAEAYANQGPVVFDRLHVGSYVYGTVFRGADDMSRFERWLFDGMMVAADATMVYTRPPTTVMDAAQGTGDRGPDAVYESRMAQVYDAYTEFFGDTRNEIGDGFVDHMPRGMSDIPTIVYDWTRHDPQSIIDYVARRHWNHELLGRVVKQDVPAIGNVYDPRYIFVGEQPHARELLRRRATRRYPGRANTERRNTAWARMCEIASALPTREVVFDSSSGGYLATALMNTGLSLNDYCVFNSTLLDGRTAKDFILRTGGAKVIALGNVASAALDAADIRHTRVPHPQHVKRFFYKRGLLEYPKVLLGTQKGSTLTWRS